MRLILAYIRPHVQRIVGGMAMKFIGTIADLLLPWILTYILNNVIPAKDQALVFLWGGAMLACSGLALAFNVLANRVAAAVARDATETLRHDLFDRISHLSSGAIDRFTIPSLISRMTTDTFYVYRMIGMMQRVGIRAPILLLGGVLITLTIDVTLSLILIAMLPFMALVVYFISRRGVPLYAKLQIAVDTLVRVVRENASGIRIIKALSKSEDEKARFDKINRQVAHDETKASVVMAVNSPVMQFLLNFGLVVVVVVGARLVDAGRSQPGTIVAFLSYFTIILNAMLTITRILTMYSKALASSRRIDEVLCADIEQAALAPAPAVPGAAHITFEGVTFSYNKKTPDVRDISFSLARGQSLGVLGATGAGKSTLIRLLLRFYEADAGRILVDGRDIRGLALSELRGRIGVVFQNDALFRGIVSDNIRLGRQISKAEIDDAAERAQASTFIAQAGGMDAEVQTRGQNFSGGQQQRLLLARALAGRPEILLLDDATSALDFKTEAAFRQGLRERSEKPTTMIVAQRISAVMHCDKILVLDDGATAGFGSHDELMRDCELYREIASLQIGGDIA